MIRFEDLLERVRAYTSDEEREFLRRAYVFSALEHKGQVRHSGEPYLVHPLEKVLKSDHCSEQNCRQRCLTFVSAIG